ncbi:TadE family protein [Microbacterium sp. BWT-B31]|uniref:TadE family protein n=1 Tax=Microbacterium sp. BWT-B31 TaxID=3232072 RepID=UPI0035290A65
MPLSNRSTDPDAPATVIRTAGDSERGSASLEFILVGLLMLVPLVYLVVTLGLVQGQSLGVEAGARHLARAVSTATDAADADARAERVLASIADEYGMDPSSIEVAIDCRPAGASCPHAGAMLHVTIAARIALPLAPPVLGLERFASIPVEASAVQKVSRLWGGS